MKNSRLLCVSIIFVLTFFFAESVVIGAERSLDSMEMTPSFSTADSIFELMPDAEENPEAYTNWKNMYSEALAEESEPMVAERLRPFEPMVLSLDNGYVDFNMNDGGSGDLTGIGVYSEGCRPSGGGSWMNLTYFYPSTPWDYTIYKIDSNTPEKSSNRSGTGTNTLPNPDSYYIIGNKCYAVWNNLHGVQITQVLECVSLGSAPGDIEQVKRTNIITPADGSCHDVGCLVYFDTKLNSSDGANIATAYGYTGTASIHYAPDIPPTWRAFEHGAPPVYWGIEALGILIGFEATMPDVFWYGNWGASTGNGWDDAQWNADAGGGFSGDTAAMVKWYQRSVCPGDTLVYTTYYGIGHLDPSAGLNITHGPPDLEGGCAGVTPNPAPFDVIITNMGLGDATSVEVTLDLSGTPLTVASGANPQNLGTIAGSGGGSIASWTVNIPSSAYGTTQCYDIIVNYSGGSESEHYCIDIPEEVEFSVTAAADDYELCEGECTNLYAFLDTTEIPDHTWSYTWHPTDFLSDPTVATPFACPESSITYWVVASDRADCIDSDFVEITVEPNPIVIFRDTTICSGDSIRLYPEIIPDDHGYSYLWTPGGETTRAIIVSPTSFTTYSLAVSTPGGCTGFGDGTVYIDPPIRVDAGSPDTICNGDTVMLGGSPTAAGGDGNFDYFWEPPIWLTDPNTANPFAAPESTITYRVTVVDSFGCEGYDSVTIEVDQPPSGLNLLYPPDDTTGILPGALTLIWNSAEGAPLITYDLYMNGVLVASGLTDTIYDTLANCTEYVEWQVLAINHCGIDSSEIWDYSVVPCEPPWAYLIDPFDGAWTACNDQEITLVVNDDISVDTMSIRFTVNGTTYDITYPQLAFEDDSFLVFTPIILWDDGDTIEWSLDSLADEIGTETVLLPSGVFYVDLSSPVAWGFYPPGDTIITDASVPISAWIADSLSGLDTGSVYISVDGLPYYLTSAAMEYTWDSLGIGMSLYLHPTIAGLNFEHNDTVRICVGGYDTPDYCEPNTLEVCWDIYVDLEGPIVEEPFDPGTGVLIDGLTSACNDQGFCLPLYDPPLSHGIMESTIVLTVNGTDFTTSDPELTYDHDTLCFLPDTLWMDGASIVIEMTAVEDSLGNPLTGGGYMWVYYIDLVSPEISGETPGGAIGTLTPVAYWNLVDLGVGLDYDNTLFAIDALPVGAGTTWYDLSLPAYDTLGGGDYEVDITSIPFTVSGGDTARICIRAWDQPDLCPPNQLDTCWLFWIPTGGPVGTIVEPLPGTYSACDPQDIWMTITDINGVEDSTILFSVNGIHFTVDSPELEYYDDTLHFMTPAGMFSDGEVVVCSLLAADDIYENELEDIVAWTFTMDFLPPVISGVIPLPGAVVASLCPNISFDLDDIGSGLDESSIEVDVMGTILDTGSPEVIWGSGNFSFDLCDVVSVTGGDILDICVTVGDSPDYCDPNELDTCWSFSIESGGPVGTIEHPEDGIITSCDPQDITLSIIDSNGVNDTTIELIVDGVSYSTSSAELSWSSPMLTFDGGPGFFTHGATVNVELVAAEDMLGNPLDATLAWSFIVDYEPPVFSAAIYPPPGVPVDDRSPLITMPLEDIPAGIDYDSPVLDVPGYGAFDITSPAIYWIGDDLYFDPDSVGIEWSGGDSMELCLDIADLPDTIAPYCAANETTYCWWLLISRGGPMAEIIEPAESTFSACSLQQIIVEIVDSNGVDDSTIELLVNGTSYMVGSPELDWLEPTLTWTPPAVWPSGPVHVELISANDILGNELENSLDWWFTMDLLPPYYWSESPVAGAIVADPSPDLSIRVADTLAGLADSCLWMTINGSTPYRIGDIGVNWDGELWEFSTSDAGLTYSGGDSITACLHACDDPDYCPPNESIHCWTIWIATGGPIAEIIEPLDSTISACSLQQIIVDITDSNGVDETTIELEVNGTVYTISSSELSWSVPRLTWTPPSVWTDGPVNVRLLAASDLLGNELESAPVVWSFQMDLTPPNYSNFTPIDGFITGDWQQPISVEINDAILGVDPDSLKISIDGVYLAGGPIQLDLSDAGISWTDPLFAIDPSSVDESAFGITYNSPDDTLGPGIYFPEMATIDLIVSAFDNMPDYCDPNGSDTVWSFDVLDDDTLGPNIFAFGPAYQSTQTPVYLEARISDDSEIYSAELIWDDDGELVTDFNGPVAMDSVPMSYDAGTNSRLWRTTTDIGSFISTRDIAYRITALDADWDFQRDADRSESIADSVCPILGGPMATWITPEPGQITACADQQIVISLTDADGVNPAPMTLIIAGQTYTWPDTRLSYDPTAGELTFDPGVDIWTNEQEVTVLLTLAEDSLGNPMWDTLEYSFLVDLEPPTYSNEFPLDGTMVRDNQIQIWIDISDNLAGVRNSELRMDIYGNTYVWGAPSLTYDSGRLLFSASTAGIEFTAGDTIDVHVYSGDDPDLCDPNQSDFEWSFLMEPKITCNLFPNPFTPNGDAINDFTVFDYPMMFSGEAELIIFNVRNTPVYQTTIGPVEDMTDYSTRNWMGLDSEGKKLPQGLYLYIIKKDGEIICNGTVTILR